MFKFALAVLTVLGMKQQTLSDINLALLPDFTNQTCFAQQVQVTDLSEWCEDVEALSRQSVAPGDTNTGRYLARLSNLKDKHAATYDEETHLEKKLGLLEVALLREQTKLLNAFLSRMTYQGKYDSKRSVFQKIRLLSLQASVGLNEDPDAIDDAVRVLLNSYLSDKALTYTDRAGTIVAGNFAYYYITNNELQKGLELLQSCTNHSIANASVPLTIPCFYQILRSQSLDQKVVQQVAQSLQSNICGGLHKSVCEALSPELKPYLQ
ncbi:MAG: hypothetical protein JJ850_09595 [Kordiimonadaceae bacterium]|nr:hypothetical protein [Kordiimonadaceae bacterium]MBO6569384.1 hypothetical protein [Kordiimonadaceae bacterium]MBO6964859.1 hypothetical protein [Kordiimonadaceae bacterium]